MKTCSICQNSKPLEDFYIDRARHDGRQGLCKLCSRVQKQLHYRNNIAEYKARTKRRRLRLRKLVDDYKAGRSCHICGENDACCLDFHHKNKHEKQFELSKVGSHRYAIETIMAEIAKCVLLCANCHRKLHAGKIALS